jgi:hypothetical protein
MTEYTNVPQANLLINEQQQVRRAISIIDEGGTLTSVTVAPLPPTPGLPPSPNAVNAIGIQLPDISPPETMAAVRARLVERDDAITQQLADLGVTSSPPARFSR